MRAILEYELPKEREQWEQAFRSEEAFCAIYEIQLRLGKRKKENPAFEIALDIIHDVLEEQYLNTHTLFLHK